MGKIIARIHSFFVNHAEEPEWCIALRKKTDIDLVDGNNKDFMLIKNPARYWYADPFLFEHQNETYIFVEMYDRFNYKGCIGVSKIKHGKPGKFKKIIELPVHMSYPCIFRYKDDIVMIPETYQAKKITLFKAMKFPFEWKEDKNILEGFAVDTTPIPNTDILLTTLFENIKPEINDNLYMVSMNEPTKQKLFAGNLQKRCGGHFILKDNLLLRPSQNCEKIYGGSLIINKVLNINVNEYEENFSGEVFPQDIKLTNIKTNNFLGIHTYNATAKYEIIDLSYREEKKRVLFAINFSRYVFNQIRKGKNHE